MYNVMIVDDEPIIRKGLHKLFEQSGHPIKKILTAETGADALEQIVRECPDFLFTDIRMPKMDGIELCRQLSEMDVDIEIAVVSGYSDFEYARNCIRYGVKEYLLKPVNKKAIRTTLEKLIRSRDKRRSHRTFIPERKMKDWVTELSDAVWLLQVDKLEITACNICLELREYRLSHLQLSDVLGKLYQWLCRNLNERSTYQLKREIRLTGLANFEDIWRNFEFSLYALCKELQLKRHSKIKDPIDEAKDYIEKNITKEITLEEVAKYIGFNPSYFSQLFKHSTNETFVQFRTRIRMEKAKRLLENPSNRITDVSAAIGYADHPYFTKVFKKQTGYLPSEYRQKLGID